ncbi:MAG: STN domain-containing protein, partial [Planctomycetales bacterium]|nr:STN domain-containing protein [Planctomycetales bacterium]
LADEALPDDATAAADDLCYLVTGALAPETWEDVGGPGSVSVLRKSLIVSQARSVHEEVAQLLGALAAAQAADLRALGDKAVPRFPQAGAAEARIAKALAKRVTLDFVETPLADVADFMREKIQVEIQVDARALDDVGIGTDTPINLHVKNISAAAALRHMLRELDLTYTVVDEVVMITTPEEAETRLQTRVYPVADLLRAARDVTDEFLPDDAQGAAAGDELIELVTATASPATWEDVGGPGSISVWNDCLVVAQTEEVFDEVEGLLAGLRTLQRQVDDPAAAKATAPVRLDEWTDPSLEKLRAALAKEMGMAQFKETPLAEAIDFCAEKHGLPLLIGKRALEDVGIDADSVPVTISLGGESIDQALTRMLRPLDLIYRLRNEAILI